jgi:phosphate transport system substrate-binding protein
MNRFRLTVFITAFIILVCTGCKEPEIYSFDFENLRSSIIEGLTFNNYPKIDGSTSNLPLSTIIACNLFGIEYKWVQDFGNLQRVEPIGPGFNRNDTAKFMSLINSSQTHQSFINLINKNADIILSARSMSLDEKEIAVKAGVELIETPIALDAFIFIVHPDNPIQSLTIEQIQGIYTGVITNWNEVGGNDAEIHPFLRNPNSGSQEMMEKLVMKDLEFKEWLPVSWNELLVVIDGMVPVIETVSYDVNSICYTFFYYKENMIANLNLGSSWDLSVKTINIEGILPNKETISDKSYPLIAEVYSVIRYDQDESSMAYKLHEWLQTEMGQKTIYESGYVRYK